MGIVVGEYNREGKKASRWTYAGNQGEWKCLETPSPCIGIPIVDRCKGRHTIWTWPKQFETFMVPIFLQLWPTPILRSIFLLNKISPFIALRVVSWSHFFWTWESWNACRFPQNFSPGHCTPISTTVVIYIVYSNQICVIIFETEFQYISQGGLKIMISTSVSGVLGIGMCHCSFQ